MDALLRLMEDIAEWLWGSGIADPALIAGTLVALAVAMGLAWYISRT